MISKLSQIWTFQKRYTTTGHIRIVMDPDTSQGVRIMESVHLCLDLFHRGKGLGPLFLHLHIPIVKLICVLDLLFVAPL